MIRIILITGLLFLIGCGKSEPYILRIDHAGISIAFDEKLRSQVENTILPEKKISSDLFSGEYLFLQDARYDGFIYSDHTKAGGTDQTGTYDEYIIRGRSGDLIKKITIRAYNDFPDLLTMKVAYLNQGHNAFTAQGWVSNNLVLSTNVNESPAFWSFNGASYEDRRDWILPVTPGFRQKNYLGMNATDYGGGIPVSVIWNRTGGFSVGHLEAVPKLVSLPVTYDSTGKSVSISVMQERAISILPGDSVETLKTFVAAHTGDFFPALQKYSRFMRRQGMTFTEIPASAYEPIWCAWGYERNFTVAEVLQTLPKVKDLGFRWAVLDDGWQTAEGDWYLAPKKFPRGDRDMQALVKKINRSGLRAKLWWAALAVDPGTDLLRDHPDMLLLNKEGKPQDISWWDSYYLCPAYEKTRTYTKGIVKKIMQNWGFEGLKIDGQHLNGVPPCYNPLHNHAYPEEAVEQLPQFFSEIYKTAISITPDAVVEICPCGTAASFFNMPYMNQPVSSDPLTSWQIRLKGKTFKALMGPGTPYYGDHVELSDGGTDFASSVGIGAVVGTKFTWPGDRHSHSDYLLTPEKEVVWGKWLKIYETYRLSEGEYLGNLYDIGFDRPEAHVIKRDNTYFYAFYADTFEGEISLRGLPPGRYLVSDYEEGRHLSAINASQPNLSVNFKDHLLLKAEKAE